jgi:RHS repeat-associated protein
MTLDQLGNWSGYAVKAAGTTTLNQSRAHNSANEIDTDNTHGDVDDSITQTTGTNWRDPVHDAAGNMTTIGWRVALGTAEVLTYDAWNRLVKSYIGLVVQTNEYDGLGRRIVRVNGWANPDETYDYYYNENWQVVEERKDGDANPSSQYYWHPYYIDALAFRIYDATLTGTDSVIHYYVHDANFNVTAILDDTADVLERYQYMPYGEVTFLEPDFDVAASQSSQHGNTHLYTGRERDPETARQLNRHRFYAPYLGRWLTRDPIGYGDGMNLFEYIAGRPTTLIDPSGLLPLNVGNFPRDCLDASGSPLHSDLGKCNGATDTCFSVLDKVKAFEKAIRCHRLFDLLLGFPRHADEIAEMGNAIDRCWRVYEQLDCRNRRPEPCPEPALAPVPIVGPSCVGGYPGSITGPINPPGQRPTWKEITTGIGIVIIIVTPWPEEFALPALPLFCPVPAF